MPGYDVAIIGLGAMGSFTALELAGRGVSVIGFDRFSPPHEQGSHGGETRAFRTIYTEHPDYVPLMKRALEHWERLAAEGHPELLTWTGVLSLGESGSPLLDGVQQSAAVHGLPVQTLSADEVRRRFPRLESTGELYGAAGRPRRPDRRGSRPGLCSAGGPPPGGRAAARPGSRGMVGRGAGGPGYAPARNASGPSGWWSPPGPGAAPS